LTRHGEGWLDLVLYDRLIFPSPPMGGEKKNRFPHVEGGRERCENAVKEKNLTLV
jgi:hypothetical protein